MGLATIGWGIVGLGRIAATEIAPAIAQSSNGHLVAVVSRDQARADAFAAAHGAARGLDDFEAMLRDPEVDAVYIATPNALHADQVVAAASAGKHVLCDKPLATTVVEAQRSLEACQAAGVRLGITFQTRNHEKFAEVARLVREGAIGRVVVAQVEMSAGRNLPGGWRTNPALAGLGTINNIGVHGFDVLRYLVGSEVAEVAAMVDREEGFEVDTTALVLLRFANGTLAYVNANQSVPQAQDDVVLYGSQGRILARNLSRPGRNGTLSVITPDGQQEYAITSTGAYARTVSAFADAVLGGRDPDPSGLDGLRSVELTAAVATAIDERRTVRTAQGPGQLP